MAEFQFYSEQITAVFAWGGNPTLTSSWKDKNVIIPHNKMFYITDGEIEVEIDGKKIVAKSGDMVLIPSGVRHSYNLTPMQYAKKFWMHFDLLTGGNNFFDHYHPPFKLSVGKSKVLEDLFRSVLNYARKNKPEHKLLTCSSILSIVAFYMQRCVYRESAIIEDEIDLAVEIIKNNYSEKFTLEELAKRINLSPNYFVKKFKERTGYSPMQYVVIIKMERAKFLIEQSDAQIGKIMEELGFYDASHFSKLFKKYSGYSPKKFREISQERFGVKN